MRFKTILAAALTALALAAPPAGAVTTPTNGVYLSCTTYAYCQQHIDRLGYVGVKTVIQSIPNTYSDAAAISERWRAWGTNVRWNTGSLSEVAAPSWTSTLYSNSPTNAWLHGFYVVDEPAKNGLTATDVGRRVNIVNTYAPGKQSIMAHYGCGQKNLAAALNPYVTLGAAHGNVCYPITDHDADSYEDAGLVYGGYLKLRERASTYGKWAFAVPKAFSWREVSAECGFNKPSCDRDRFPSQAEFQTMKNCAAKANLDHIYWWGYDLWKDWIATDPAQYNQRWNDFVNGGLLSQYVDVGNCHNT